MDFAMLPPEVNSGLMYTGPGAGSLLAAANSWDELAIELGTTAQTYESVLSGLTSVYWAGPASESMAAKAAPYVWWLHSTAEQTRQTATQCRAAAMAFEQAYAMTVPPPVILANRMQLMSLVATNFFGQNTAAIAALETQYAEMWEQDAAAMYGYATSAAMAAQLVPFSSPQQTANPAGLSAQSAAVNQADATAAAANPLSDLIALVQKGLAALAGAFPNLLPDDFSILDGIFAGYATVGVSQDCESIIAGIIGAESNLGMLGAASENPAELAPGDIGIGSVLSSAPSVGGAVSGPGAVLVSVGRAGSIGQLSVPASWAAPATRQVAALSSAGLTTIPGTEEVAHGIPGMPGMPVGSSSRASSVVPRYGVRLTVMAHPPAAG